MTKQEATALVAVLMASYPRQPVEPPTIEAYAAGIGDLDAGLATTAVRTLQHESRFFPTVAEIRDTYAELLIGAPLPMHAWEQAQGAGPRHPLVDRARALVGDGYQWRSEPTWSLRRWFLDAYPEVRRSAVREVAAPALAQAERRALPAGEAEPDPPALEEGDDLTPEENLARLRELAVSIGRPGWVADDVAEESGGE